MWQALVKTVGPSLIKSVGGKVAGDMTTKELAKRSAFAVAKKVQQGRQDAQSRQNSRASGLQFLDTNVSNWTD